MKNREELIAAAARGDAVEYLFFWGHTPKAEGIVDRSCLSQWFPRAFEIDGIRYATAEHFMMASKARLFGDEDALGKILSSTSPADAKALGRAVRNFDGGRWEAARFDAVVRGNVAKFSQHSDLASFLLGTAPAVLVEASPRDTIWGIGLGASNPNARDPSRWRGRNLLGFALMEVRAIITRSR
jgi:ribA/ribD-fused uncharacterized protein